MIEIKTKLEEVAKIVSDAKEEAEQFWDESLQDKTRNLSFVFKTLSQITLALNAVTEEFNEALKKQQEQNKVN